MVRLVLVGVPVVDQAKEARRQADHAVALAAQLQIEAVQVLMRTCRMSVRDAATVLGVSHQRVHQLAEMAGGRGAKRAPAKRAKKAGAKQVAKQAAKKARAQKIVTKKAAKKARAKKAAKRERV